MRASAPNFNGFMRAIVTLLLLLLTASPIHAQTITGIVTADLAEGSSISEVIVQNIHTAATLTTDASGRFSIPAKPGELIEFHKMGYKTERVRIISSSTPYYRIIMQPGVHELEGVEIRKHFNDYQHDSLRYREMFKKQLNYPVVTGWRAIQSPFSALSKTNKQMISFQKEYEWLERQKFVDHSFNEKLIANLTGLKGDSAVKYMRQYRPTYEMLRSMPDYDYFAYVKHTVAMWRQRQRLGPSNSRGGG